MKKISLILSLGLALAMAGQALASPDYGYISPDEVKAGMEAGDEVTIVDICEPEMFDNGHIEGSVGTGAYPVKSDGDIAKLAEVLPGIEGSTAPVVIVCPKGKGGAKRTYDYFKGKGVAAERLKILEGGLTGWPHEKVTD